MSDRYNPYGKRKSPGEYGSRRVEPSSGKLRRGEIDEQLSLQVEPSSSPRLHDVYKEFSGLLTSGDTDTLRAIHTMLPDQDMGILTTALVKLSRDPSLDEYSDPSVPQTIRLDEYEQDEMGLHAREASQLKWTIGSFNPQSGDTIEQLLESGNITFELFERIMIEYSATQSDTISGVTEGRKCLIDPSSSKPLSGYTKVLGPGTDFPFPFPVYFDVETANWIGEFLKGSVISWGRKILDLSKRGIDFGINFTVYIGGRTVKVGIFSLILLFNITVKTAEETAGRAGQIMKYILRVLFNQKELLFSGPFANITNPPEEETQKRRLKRFIMVYLYTMAKLLSVMKLCITKSGGIEWLREPILQRGRETLESLIEFLNKDISEWSINHILNWGSIIFNIVLGEGNRSLYYNICPELERDFMDLYKYSLKVQFDLLNIRIMHSDNDPMKVVTSTTPLGNLITVINNASDMRMVDADSLVSTQNLVKEALEGVVKFYGYQVARQKIEQLFVPGGLLENKRDEWMTTVMGYLSEYDLSSPVPEDSVRGDEPLSQDLIDSSSDMSGGGKRKKRSKKRRSGKRKSKKRRSGKRKKTKRKSKRKKTKRKSKRQMKEKLIDLINSL